ncbi:receptor-type tyrosine-protein phosphatase S isoform X2 [Patella vulgata]|uniref:receptor-type tyrosine-protein phosphatase S isoform X2 n=1 Tax=Patella vulgata TaxID=6465 RepID=UPI00217FAE3C|nr:receptor-type tyrosine-protein phosphatase S isoform X2 [Patella vulgata]
MLSFLLDLTTTLICIIMSFGKRRTNFQDGAKKPIILSKMKAEVEAFHRDDNLLISLHYEDLTKLSPKFNSLEAKKEENTLKNRYINIHPFDHTRVCLPIKDEDVNSDYINANYIPGYSSSKEYIATQGPLPDTINDFWRMIWHEKVSIIVMLTSLKEGHTIKCEQYWPDEVDEVMEYGQYTVEKISEVTKKTHTCSTLKICCNEDSQNNKKTECRTVKHFHYLQWKDKSAALERSDILQFIRTVRQNIKSNDTSPVVVHCSAGVGRTGTYIALDYIQQYIDQHDLNKTIDIYEYVLKLRSNRVLMVQTESQYSFLYDCAVQLIEDKQNKTQDIESDQQTNPDDPIYENTRDSNGVMTTVI